MKNKKKKLIFIKKAHQKIGFKVGVNGFELLCSFFQDQHANRTKFQVRVSLY